MNYKKVFAVVIVLAVIVMIIVTIIKITKKDNNNDKMVNTVSYFSSYLDGKWGVINNLGETVIEPTYDEMIIIPNKSKPVFVCIYDINDQDGTYKTKVINNENEEILQGYDKVEAIDNFDSKQNIWYEDNCLKVSKEGKYGLISFEGTELLPCEYEEIISLKSVTGNILVKKDGKLGLVNEKGQAIIPTAYKDIKILKEEYKNEYIIVDDNNKYGLISTSGTIILEPKYESIKYIGSSEVFSVKEAGVLKLVDANNKVLIEGKYDDFIHIKGDNIIVVKASKYGIINKNGEEKIAPSYDELKYAFGENYIAKKEGNYGVVNLVNETKLDFVYTKINYVDSGNFMQADISEAESAIFDDNFSEKFRGVISEVNIEKGYIKVYKDNKYKYYNFKFEEKNVADVLTSNTLFLGKKDGKYGYVDSAGKEVVGYIYDDGTEQNKCGFAAIKKDGKWGAIDKLGKVILEPSVNLDESIFVDFIGEWHLDTTGLYYTK